MKAINKNIILLSFLLLQTILVFSQKRKRNYYYNLDNELINKAIFRKFNKSDLYHLTKENDTAIIHTIHKRIIESKLTIEQKNQVNSILQRIVRKKIDTTKTLVIHLYEDDDLNLKIDSKNARYWNWVKENPNLVDAYLIGTKNSKIKPFPNLHIFIDEYDFLKKFFFKNSNVKYKHLYIKPDGSFKLFYGSYDIINILDNAF